MTYQLSPQAIANEFMDIIAIHGIGEASKFRPDALNLINEVLTNGPLEAIFDRDEQDTDRIGKFCIIIQSEEHLIELYKYHNITSDGFSNPVEYAHYDWSHEQAHRKRSQDLGIDGVIKVYFIAPQDGKKVTDPNPAMRYSICFESDVQTMKENIRCLADYFAYIAEVADAPRKVGSNYDNEDNFAAACRKAAILVQSGILN